MISNDLKLPQVDCREFQPQTRMNTPAKSEISNEIHIVTQNPLNHSKIEQNETNETQKGLQWARTD